MSSGGGILFVFLLLIALWCAVSFAVYSAEQKNPLGWAFAVFIFGVVALILWLFLGDRGEPRDRPPREY